MGPIPYWPWTDDLTVWFTGWVPPVSDCKDMAIWLVRKKCCAACIPTCPRTSLPCLASGHCPPLCCQYCDRVRLTPFLNQNITQLPSHCNAYGWRLTDCPQSSADVTSTHRHSSMRTCHLQLLTSWAQVKTSLLFRRTFPGYGDIFGMFSCFFFHKIPCSRPSKIGFLAFSLSMIGLIRAPLHPPSPLSSTHSTLLCISDTTVLCLWCLVSHQQYHLWVCHLGILLSLWL